MMIRHKYRRVVIVSDAIMSVVTKDIISFDEVECYTFNAGPPFTQLLFLFEALAKPFPIEYPKELPSSEDCLSDEMMTFMASSKEPHMLRSGDLFNTSRSLESTFLDVLERGDSTNSKKIWAIGPMLPTILPSSSSSADQESSEGCKHKCLEWLDKHEPNSVIYVSFGTTTSLSDEEIRELALGLEQSKAKFLWILRDADRGNVFDGDVRRFELPPDFEERVEGTGLVFRDWAPQLDILAHPLTGGFMTHCGWNSCLESIRMGVPLATWPMHSDQPGNAYLVTEVLKAGLVVREWTQRKEVMKAPVIADVITRLMASEEGDVIRKRAQELGETLKKATEESGCSRLE